MLNLSYPQHVFLNGLSSKFRGFIGGFGSGKTFVGCLDLLIFAGKHPKSVQGYFGKNYPSIRDVFYPTFEEAAHLLGFTVKIRVTNKEIDLYRNGIYYGMVICRSMDDPSSIIGFKIARALVDEIDTLPREKAKLAWNKIIARLRLKISGVINSVGVTTTPEGFLFAYSLFAENPTESYSMVQASSYSNLEHLPDDYINSLLETYPAELVDAYVHGKFVNLKSGTVYRQFSRSTCSSTETIQPREALYIGQDFNVNQMASVVHVKRGEVFHAVGELTKGKDTPALCDTLTQKYPDHPIIIYPDASGRNASSKGAAVSDISILKHAGFRVRVNPTNPFVRDRVLAMNAAFTKGLLKVNANLCPEFVKCLEQQAYDANGEPDKSSGHDHLNDAGGYPIAYEMPINRPVIHPAPIAL